MVQEYLLIGMKRFGVVILMLISGFIKAQNRTNVWELGTYTIVATYPKCGLDFSNGTADTFSLVRPMGMFITNASMCDTDGNLIFYTNGIWIGNRNHDTLKNSDNFNPRFWTDYYSPDGLGACQAVVIIPRPDHSKEYFIFHITGQSIDIDGDLEVQPTYLSVSKVNMSLDNGLGGIPLNWKNKHVVDDTLVWGRLTACKHANGRDWWIISHKAFSDLYYEFLVNPDTILGPYVQHIGSILLRILVGWEFLVPMVADLRI